MLYLMIELWLWLALAVSEIIWLTALSTVIFADTDRLVDCNCRKTVLWRD